MTEEIVIDFEQCTKIVKLLDEHFTSQKALAEVEYPLNIKKKDLRMAKYLVTQYGGSNGELSAALRYLNQRFTMPDNKGKALLTDIGTEELAHKCYLL